MNEDVKKVKVTPKTQRPRYKWEELEVGEGYPCPYASTQGWGVAHCTNRLSHGTRTNSATPTDRRRGCP